MVDKQFYTQAWQVPRGDQCFPVLVAMFEYVRPYLFLDYDNKRACYDVKCWDCAVSREG